MIRPQLVERAFRLADHLGFTRSCLDEVGAVLHVLAGATPSGSIADIGTGCGVSAAWMASATLRDIFTVDNDPSRAADIHRDNMESNAHLGGTIGGEATSYNVLHPMQWRDRITGGSHHGGEVPGGGCALPCSMLRRSRAGLESARSPRQWRSDLVDNDLGGGGKWRVLWVKSKSSSDFSNFPVYTTDTTPHVVAAR